MPKSAPASVGEALIFLKRKKEQEHLDSLKKIERKQKRKEKNAKCTKIWREKNPEKYREGMAFQNERKKEKRKKVQIECEEALQNWNKKNKEERLRILTSYQFMHKKHRVYPPRMD